MRRNLFLAGLAGLAVLGVLWSVAVSFRGQRPPAHEATATLPELGLTVTAELFVLSDLTEFERRFALDAGGETLTVRMPDARGPAHRTELLRRVDGSELAVFCPSGEGRAFAVHPLRLLDAPSLPSDDWVRLGAFELSMVPNGAPGRGQAQVFAFVPADAEAPQRARAMQNSTIPASARFSAPSGNTARAVSAASP